MPMLMHIIRRLGTLQISVFIRTRAALRIFDKWLQIVKGTNLHSWFNFLISMYCVTSMVKKLVEPFGWGFGICSQSILPIGIYYSKANSVTGLLPLQWPCKIYLHFPTKIQSKPDTPNPPKQFSEQSRIKDLPYGNQEFSTQKSFLIHIHLKTVDGHCNFYCFL